MESARERTAVALVAINRPTRDLSFSIRHSTSSMVTKIAASTIVTLANSNQLLGSRITLEARKQKRSTQKSRA